MVAPARMSVETTPGVTELTVTPEAVTLVLEALDRIKSLLATLEEKEAEPEGDDGELVGALPARFAVLPAALSLLA